LTATTDFLRIPQPPIYEVVALGPITEERASSAREERRGEKGGKGKEGSAGKPEEDYLPIHTGLHELSKAFLADFRFHRAIRHTPRAFSWREKERREKKKREETKEEEGTEKKGREEEKKKREKETKKKLWGVALVE